MAVLLEFANVILRKSAIESSLPGGVDTLLAFDVANISEDNHLFRIGFMSTSEVDLCIGLLVERGFPADLVPDNVASVQWSVEPHPHWLETGLIEDVSAAWLRGTAPGAVAKSTFIAILCVPAADRPAILEALGECCCLVGATVGPSRESFIAERAEARVNVVLLVRDDGDTLVHLDREITRRGHWATDAQLLEDLMNRLVAIGAAVEWPR